jgi:hypothetical protein
MPVRPSRRTLLFLVPAGVLLAVLAVVGITAFLGAFGPPEYGTGDRDIQAEAGEQFVLSFPISATQGEWWYRVGPAPDENVVRSRDESEDYEGSDAVGGGGDGAQRFTFEAVRPGTTRIRVLHCPYGTCTGKGASATPKPGAVSSISGTPAKARYYTFTVTVR